MEFFLRERLIPSIALISLGIKISGQVSLEVANLNSHTKLGSDAARFGAIAWTTGVGGLLGVGVITLALDVLDTRRIRRENIEAREATAKALTSKKISSLET